MQLYNGKKMISGVLGSCSRVFTEVASVSTDQDLLRVI